MSKSHRPRNSLTVPKTHMKKFVCCLLLVALVFSFNAGSIAWAEEVMEETGNPQASSTAGPMLSIDTRHLYEGMEKSYSQGYLPTVSKGKATLVLPLQAENIAGALTAAVDLGDPEQSPFDYRNYEDSFTKKDYTFGEKTMACYLVRFSLGLVKNRINGCYPVTIAVSGRSESGEVFTQDFTVYVNIRDGMEPHSPEAGPSSEPEPPVFFQPKLMVTAYNLKEKSLTAGGKGSLTITLRNTSDSQPAKNIKLAFLEEGGELYPEGTGATYCRRLSAGGTFTWELAVTALTTAQSKPHPAVITMQYEDSQGQPVTSADRIILPVRQPVRLEYEEPSLPPRVTAGDTVPFSLTLMNLGKSTIYNALLKFEIPGLASGGSVLVGTISPGESATGTTNFRVESAPLGEVSGTLTLSYEDEHGEQYEQEILLNTKLEQKKEVAPPSNEIDDSGPCSTRWIWAAAAAVVLALGSFFVIRWQKEKKVQEEDEMRL